MRAAIPLAVAVVILALVGLYLGAPEAYMAVTRALAAPAFEVPFIDLHAVFAAFECHRQGVDVLRVNPCDFHGRQHVYSPLWLPLATSGLGVRHTVAGGLALAGLYVLSLAVLYRPGRPWQVAVALLAALSPSALFALERGNNDLVVYLLMIPAAHLIAASDGLRRGLGHGVVVAAGFLKYYPWIGLALLVRERPRRVVLAAVAFPLLLGGFLLLWRDDLAVIAGNVPITDGLYHISARNLLLAVQLNAAPWIVALVALVLALSFLTAVVVLTRHLRRLRLTLDMGRPRHVLLLLGGLLLTGCFFTGSSLPYRGVLLVLTLPALLELAEAHPDPAARRFAVRAALGLALLPWLLVPHQALLPLADHMAVRVAQALLLTVKELGWWAAAALFTALYACVALESPLGRRLASRLRGQPR